MPDQTDSERRRKHNGIALPYNVKTRMTRPKRVRGMRPIEVDGDGGDRLNDRKKRQGRLRQKMVIRKNLIGFRAPRKTLGKA
jgi:hypothetical protein